MSEWVSVDEMLPAENESVLVWTIDEYTDRKLVEDGQEPVGWCESVGHYTTGTHTGAIRWHVYGATGYAEVSHWQPLPPPPPQEEGQNTPTHPKQAARKQE